jgi:hypothetical protein
VKALITEEKGSDVALGAHLVWDACHGAMDVAMVISNDSDLQEPICLVEQCGIEVVVVNPHRHKKQANHLHGTSRRKLHLAHLAKSQLPDVVRDHEGRAIRKPPSWSLTRNDPPISAGRADLTPEEGRWVPPTVDAPQHGSTGERVALDAAPLNDTEGDADER